MQEPVSIRILEKENNRRGDLFGRLMADLFVALGYEQPRLNIHKSGREIDLWAEHRLELRRAIAECKATAEPVGGDDLNKFVGVLDAEREDGLPVTGYFVSLAGFKETAIEQEKQRRRTKIVLLTGAQVVSALVEGRILIPKERATELAGRCCRDLGHLILDLKAELLAHKRGWIWTIYYTQGKARTHFALIHSDGIPLARALADEVIDADRDCGGKLHELSYLSSPPNSDTNPRVDHLPDTPGKPESLPEAASDTAPPGVVLSRTWADKNFERKLATALQPGSDTNPWIDYSPDIHQNPKSSAGTAPDTRPLGVFLSHTWADKDFARKLAADLRSLGVRVWIDEAEIKLGDSLIEKISSGISGMDYLAVVLSPESVQSEWVKREVEIAISHEIEGKKIKTLPLLYRHCDLPGFLRGKLYADFRGSDVDPEKYRKALALVADRLGLALEENKPKLSTSNERGSKSAAEIKKTPLLLKRLFIITVPILASLLIAEYLRPVRSVPSQSEVSLRDPGQPPTTEPTTEEEVQDLADSRGSFLLINGTFHVTGYSPDGDSIRFQAFDRSLWAKVLGPEVKLNALGHAQLRLDGIDAPEIQYQGNGQPLGFDSRSRLLSELRIKNVGWSEGRVSRSLDGVEGYILCRSVETNRRPYAFAFRDARDEADGAIIGLDSNPRMLKESVNYTLLRQGYAYPRLDINLANSIREILVEAAASAKSERLGVWALDATNSGFDYNNLDEVTSKKLVLPMLFRRVIDYKWEGDEMRFRDFIASKNIKIFLRSTRQSTSFDQILEISGSRVRLTVPPEDIIFHELDI